MAEITAKLVKELREKSGAGVMDAKKALVEVDGDIEKAIELLREKGMAKAAKKSVLWQQRLTLSRVFMVPLCSPVDRLRSAT